MESNQNNNKNEEQKEEFNLEKKVIKGTLEDYNKSYKYIEELDLKIPIDLKIEQYSYHFKYIKKVNKEIIYRCKYARRKR